MFVKIKFLLVISMLFCGGVFSQRVLDGKLLDFETKKNIPYANIGILYTSQGTISNIDGTFRIQVKSVSDTILCTYIGYEPLKISASQWPSDGKLYMKLRDVSLPAVQASAFSYLYELLPKCKKNAPQKVYTAKTLYSLDSYMNGYPVEMLECYYNGEYAGNHIQSLNLKAGRIQLADYNKHYFTNLETSKAIASLNIFGDNPYFPYTPFELSEKKLFKAYQLKLMDKYKDEGTIYHIKFTPTDTASKSYFSGEVWIDSASYFILKVDMHAMDAKPHPFMPLWETDSITKVDLHIRQSFKKVGNDLFFDVTDFSYEMYYLDRIKRLNEIKSNGILYVYDTKNKFILPYYTYDYNVSDYRKISYFPYNEFFWKNRDSVVTSEQQVNSATYLNKYGFVLHKKVPLIFAKTFFQYNNIFWTDTARLIISDISDTSILYNTAGVIPSALYKLNAQIFLDINEADGKIHTLSKSIFDAFGSYYHFPVDSNTNCFANIYFDLVETERLELERELSKSGLSVAEIQTIYINRVQHLYILTQRYLRETERGQNFDPMIKWNNYVQYRLGIDNQKKFGLKN